MSYLILIVPSWASAVRLQSSAGGPPQYLIDYTTGMIGLGDPSFKKLRSLSNQIFLLSLLEFTTYNTVLKSVLSFSADF